MKGISPLMQHPQGPPTYLPQSSSISSNLYDAPKAHMHSKHKLGHANPTADYHTYYKGLLPLAHKNISNAFWTMSNQSIKTKNNIFHYRTGALFY